MEDLLDVGKDTSFFQTNRIFNFKRSNISNH